MSITYPTTLDTLANPIGTDKVNNTDATLKHSRQHSDANDAIEALEAKVGVNGSAVTTSHDYKLSGVATGDKAASLTGIETLTNKTFTAPIITGLSVLDTEFTIKDNSDTTKKVAFEVSGVTTATTRTLTVPNENTTIVGTDATQALTNKTINAASNTVSNLATSMFATNVIDTDTSLTANSDIRIATQKATKAYADNIAAAGVTKLIDTSMVAGMDMNGSSTPKVVFIGNGTQYTLLSESAATDQTLGDSSTYTKLAVEFVINTADTKFDVVSISIAKTGSPVDNFKVSIQADSASSPSGIDLVSATLAGGTITSGFVSYDFALPYQFSSTGTYWIVLERSGAVDAANYYSVKRNARSGGGAAKFNYDGASWNNSANYIGTTYRMTYTAGSAYYAYDHANPFMEGTIQGGNRTDSTTPAPMNKPYGFLTNSVSNLGTCQIVTAGIQTISGITPASVYYLGGTSFGGVSTTAGANTRIIGRGRTTGTLFINIPIV